MISSGLFITLQQHLIAGIQKQDFKWDSIRSPPFQDLIQKRQFLSTADIDSKGHLIRQALVVSQRQLRKFLDLRIGKIIHTVIPHILHHFQCHGLSCAGHTCHNHQLHQRCPLILSFPFVDQPRRLISISRSTPDCSFTFSAT